MIFEAKELKLKNGTTAVLRSPEVEDAEQMLSYIKKACGETEFLLRYPEEWEGITIEQEAAWVKRLRTARDTLAIACFIEDKAVGNCEISFRGGIKAAHRATVAIAILKDYWNLGIGSAMFEEMIAAAREKGIEIIELEFIEGNERAKYLYEKYGFKVVAEKPNAFKTKAETYLSEFCMQKYL